MTKMERMAALPLQDADLFRQRALIGGAWVEAASGAQVAVTNPATGATLGHVPDVSAAETLAAIEAAEAAFGPWRRRTSAERAALLEAWHGLMLAHAEDLAQVLTAEQGKPLAEARAEIAYGASFVKWFAEEARRIEGSVIPAPTPDRRIVTLKQPVGVSGIITPWNFPNAMITRKVAPALAAGCTVVIKPSELTPSRR
jgi:succinate-semialdehyde dehydrogenase/glutarate-semialdehyde dehydrogenase